MFIVTCEFGTVSYTRFCGSLPESWSYAKYNEPVQAMPALKAQRLAEAIKRTGAKNVKIIEMFS